MEEKAAEKRERLLTRYRCATCGHSGVRTTALNARSALFAHLYMRAQCRPGVPWQLVERALVDDELMPGVASISLEQLVDEQPPATTTGEGQGEGSR